MKYKLREISHCESVKVVVPDIIHFVWVGDTNQVNKEYINIWRKANEGKIIYFWHDEHAYLCDAFHKSIQKHILSNDFEDKVYTEIRIKNKAFDYIFPKLMQGESFDKLVVEFLSDNEIKFLGNVILKSNPWLESKQIVTKKIDDLFEYRFIDFKRYYYYEIILRGNLASASDIVRMLIIYSYGGIYIDVDTLPYTDSIFKRTNEFIKRNKIIEDDFLFLFKTKCILNKLSIIDLDDNEYLIHYKNLFGKDINIYQVIKKLVELDIAEFSINDISPLGKLYVHKNLLSVGAIKRLKGVYFNNFIASHKNAKAVSIILRNMKKRYRFLEKKDCIFNLYKKFEEENYLARILTWRTELITRNYCVTPVLSGPGLIVEVLLGLAYELFDINDSIDPFFIAEYMQDDKFGIAFFQHNIDTPDGTNSSWRK